MEISSMTRAEIAWSHIEAIEDFEMRVDDANIRLLYKLWVSVLRDEAMTGAISLAIYKYRIRHIADRLEEPQRYLPVSKEDKRRAQHTLVAARRKKTEEESDVQQRFRIREARLYYYEVTHGYMSAEHMRHNVFPAVVGDTYIGYEL